jgi:hypothetical protein
LSTLRASHQLAWLSIAALELVRERRTRRK